MSAKTTLGKDFHTLKIKHISEVDNGLKCNCLCVKCNEKLIAINNKNNKREIHFRHEVESDCRGGIETALHLLAKQIVIENNRIRIFDDSYFDYIDSELETRLMDYTPDVILRNKLEEQWLIEIAVTSFIDDEKLKKIKRDNLNCLEIDLKNINRSITPNELKEVILEDNTVRRVINRDKHVKETKKDDFPYIVSLVFIVFLWLFKPFKRKRRKRY